MGKHDVTHAALRKMSVHHLHHLYGMTHRSLGIRHLTDEVRDKYERLLIDIGDEINRRNGYG